MDLLVVGAGAIGGYVGARLALSGDAVTLWGRRPLVAAVSARGLQLVEPDAAYVIRECRAVGSAEDAFADGRRFDVALFAVKTYDTQAAIDGLRPYASRIGALLSLQNGVSSEEQLGAAFGRERILAGTILNPVTAREPGVVALEKRRGGIGLASLQSSPAGLPAQDVARHLGRAGFVVRTYADYRSMKWSKLLLNLIGNAASAILDRTTLEVFADWRSCAVELASLREAIRVARARAIHFVGLPGYPVPLLVAALRYVPQPLLWWVMIPLVARGRGAKMPSLHIDLHAGKRRSEIDELNGAVVHLGAQVGLPTPANALLVEVFHALQSGDATADEWRGRSDRLWRAYRRKTA